MISSTKPYTRNSYRLAVSRQPVIWISRRLSDATLVRAKHDYDSVINHQEHPTSPEQVTKISQKVDGIIACHSEVFHADIISRLGPASKL